MKTVVGYFENFAFKAFDFSGDAKRGEYWLVIATIWALILFLAYGDVHEFWGFLLSREVPPLNPFYYDAFLVFVLTFIPRLSLTVRRLHDSGKRGKWAKLPFVALFSGVVVTIGLFSALATSGVVGSDLGASLGMFAIAASIVMGNAETAWQAIFATAAVLNAMGWEAIIAFLAELTAPQQHLSLSQGLTNAAQDIQHDPVPNTTMLLVAILMLCTPFVAITLHIFFMLAPSIPQDERPGEMKIAGASLRQKGEVSENPFAGYKYLYAKSEEQEAAQQAAAKQEIKSLYQQRVLGRQQTG